MAEIPLGNFGYRAPDPVQRTQIDTRGFDAVNKSLQRAANVGFGIAEEMQAEKDRERTAMQQAEAANKIGEYEIAVKTAGMKIQEDMRAGNLQYDQADAAFKSALDGIPKPTVAGMRPDLQARFDGQLNQVAQGGVLSLMPHIEDARIGKFRSDIDGILDAQGKKAGFAGADVASINASLDAMDEQGRMAYGAQWDKEKQNAKDRNWYTAINAQIIAAGDNVGALRAVKNQLNSDEFADKLDANNRLSLTQNIENKINTVENRAEMSAMRREVKAERALAQYQQQVSTGIPAKQEDVDKWRAATAGTVFAADFDKVTADEQTIQSVLRKPLSEQVAYINDRQEDLKKNGGDMTDISNVNRISTAVEANIKQIQSAPLLYSEQREDRKVQPINMNDLMGAGSDDLTANFDDRVDTLLSMRKQNGDMVKMLPLLTQEADQLSAQLGGASPAEQAIILGNLRKSIGNDEAYKGALTQIAKKQPLLALSGNIYQRNTETAETILRGNHLLNPPDDGSGKGASLALPSDEKLMSEFSAKYGDAFAGRPDAMMQAFNASKAYYAGSLKTYGDKEVDTDLFDEAMKNTIGGTYRQNNVTTIMPAGMSESDFRDSMHAAYEAARERSGGISRDFDDVGFRLVNGNTYAMMNGQQAVLDANGRPVMLTLGDKPKLSKEDAFDLSDEEINAAYGRAP